MEFIADKQTLADLNILGRYNSTSLFSLFNRVQTPGAEKLLEQMFQRPLTAPQAINTRSAMFRYFGDAKWVFPVKTADFVVAEQYLASGGEGAGFVYYLSQAVRRTILRKMGLRTEFDMVQQGLNAMMDVLRQLRPFLYRLQEDGQHPLYTALTQLLVQPALAALLHQSDKSGAVNTWRLAAIDHNIRSKLYEQVQALFDIIYQIDLAIAVGTVARDNDFVYGHALPGQEALLEIRDCRHPALQGAIGNDIRLNGSENVLFLTGANMAGKSTFMKSVGVAVYLAHMGFPVAASSMTFSVKQGIFSSINVADNVALGISHFYAEVLRVKEVAASVCAGNDLLVIFDELFKGTNVKDAFDATLEVTKAFAQFRACHFIVSTHIIEVGAGLQRHCNCIQYGYMPTVMKEKVPAYTYKLAEGISADRQGMMIIEKEGILEMIK